MTTPPAALMSHVSIGTNDYDRAIAFYDAVLAALGGKRVMELPGIAVAYGREFPEFWVHPPYDRRQAGTANGVHFAFMAAGPGAVKAFWDAALAAGATPDGEPGPRPMYGPAYYGCFVRDLDGHKIEAMCLVEGESQAHG